MKKLAVITLSAILFLTGCQTNDGPIEDASEPEEESTETLEGVDEEKDINVNRGKYEDIQVSVQDAFDIFMEKYPNAKINEIELEREDNSYEYKIQGHEENVEYELKIDAFTEEILEVEKDHEDDEKGEILREGLDKIENYVNESLEYAGTGYWVDEWQLKAKNDYTEFEVELESDAGEDLKYKFDYESGVLLEKN